MNSKILDQFYTNPDVARYLFNVIKEEVNLENKILVEPSAGTGSFSNLFEQKSIKLDLDPKQDDITKMDYFHFNPEKNDYVVIGNPPFGKLSKLAIEFFNHSSYADYICFVVPGTWRKPSVQNKLHRSYHLQYQEVLEKNSFLYNGKSHNVPCVFQIWKKEEYSRDLLPEKYSKDILHKYLSFVPIEECDFILRRNGGHAGRVIVRSEVSEEDFNSNEYNYKIKIHKVSLEKFNNYNKISNYGIKIYNDYSDIKEFLIDNYKKLNDLSSYGIIPALTKFDLQNFLEDNYKGHT